MRVTIRKQWFGQTCSVREQQLRVSDHLKINILTKVEQYISTLLINQSKILLLQLGKDKKVKQLIRYIYTFMHAFLCSLHIIIRKHIHAYVLEVC